MTFPEAVWLPLLPTLIITGTAFLVLLADLWIDGPDPDGLGWLGIVGSIVAAVASATMWNQHGTPSPAVSSSTTTRCFSISCFALPRPSRC
jgi:hypothetical protein